MLHRVKMRAKGTGQEFSLTVDDIKIPSVCPVLGIPLVIGGPLNNAPSMDRLDSALGYVPSNVRVISCRANLLKNNGTVEEMTAVLRDLKNIAPKQERRFLECISSVTVFVRHKQTCPDKDRGRDWQNCSCSKHLSWSLNGKQYRKTARTRHWDDACEVAQRLERALHAHPHEEF